MTRKVTLSLLLLFTTCFLQAQVILLQRGKPTSIRGMSIVNDKVAWISGSKGYVAITTDGGQTWAWQQVKGFEKADFRAIEAFSDKAAIIMGSGTPALILKTIDGGASWQLKYKNTDTAYFLDAMGFANKGHGFILGDPINKKFLLLETNDGGESWHNYENSPMAMPGEAAFAASGTCLRVTKQASLSIVTGGNISRILMKSPLDTEWTTERLNIAQGKQSQGAFSIANDDVIVGGDYANDKITNDVACQLIYNEGKIKTSISTVNSTGYQSCVELIAEGTYLSTGTSGTNLSTDAGKTWTKTDSQSFNVCRKARHGKLVLLAGNNGVIGKFNQ